MQLSTETMSGLLSVVGGLILLGISVTRVFVAQKIARRRINLARKIDRTKRI
jgi:hypothetical protein